MDKIILIFAVLMLLTGILTIATSSIGIECYNYTGVNKCTGNMVFMGLTLFCAIVLTIASFPAFYMAITM